MRKQKLSRILLCFWVSPWRCIRQGAINSRPVSRRDLVSGAAFVGLLLMLLLVPLLEIPLVYWLQILPNSDGLRVVLFVICYITYLAGLRRCAAVAPKWPQRHRNVGAGRGERGRQQNSGEQGSGGI